MGILPCDLCDRKFKFQYELLIHLKDHETGSVKAVSQSNGKYKNLII